MKYKILKNLHNDFKIFEKNKLAPRAYMIPFYDRDLMEKYDFRTERYNSDAVMCLSGEWNFRFYKTMRSLPDVFDTGKVKTDKITLPAVWQRTGYQPPVYLNCPYEFKTFAPAVPDDMPVGVYSRTFELPELSDKHIISFLGVANNLSLYVNGEFAGYSEGSHNTAEFDITPLLKAGTNEILAVSFKWCNGSFLEAQDMFRENGIFRDVLLYNYGSAYIYDYETQTKKEGNKYSLEVKTVLGDDRDCTVIGELKDRTGKLIGTAMTEGDGILDFGLLDVEEWNAEIPAVYTLYLTVNKDGRDVMTVRSFTGFRTIEIKNGVYLFNGRPVKVKGVNHHDDTAYKGYAMSIDDMEKDVVLMKKYNVNGVRTSHYPPDPVFTMLCDFYGLYVIDEADIETHGCCEMADDINIISSNRKWASHYVDRVKRMYFRDRNRTSVLMWSLGNESGGYYCQDRCYDFLKSTGTPVPVHYEGVSRTRRRHYDVFSEMYTSTWDIEKMMTGKGYRDLGTQYPNRNFLKQPYFLCEYAHAMGVGPGNLEEYMKDFYEWDNSMGGCIWEFEDHSVYHTGDDKKYKYARTYGGDHGEKQHDGHFCVDGLFYADRKPHTGAKEMKVCYRPVRAEYKGDGEYLFTNTNRFRNSSYIKTLWKYQIDGETVKTGELALDIPPMESRKVSIPAEIKDFADCYLNIRYEDKTTGEEIAEEQLELERGGFNYDIEIGNKISAETENGILTVNFEDGKAVFDARTGDLTSYVIKGKELLAPPADGAPGFAVNLYRATIDNDSAKREEWTKAGLDKAVQTLTDFNVNLDDGEIYIEASYKVVAKKKHLYDFVLTYCLTTLGAMEINASLMYINEKAPRDIPRFGVNIELSGSFDSIRYFGAGPAENMPDFRQHAPVGIYSSTIADQHESYVFPQENGMHCDNRWLELIDKDGDILKVFGDGPFSFCVHDYTQESLANAGHEENIVRDDIAYLTLDGFTRGIGSSSCGPDTREEYKLDCSNGLEFSFTIVPEIK